MRIFLALSLSEAVRSQAAEFQRELRRGGFEGRLMHPDDMHVTLHFLGDVDQSTAGSALGALESCAAECPPFRLTVGGVGAFPDVRRPRILWMGVGASEELTELHRRLGDRLEAAGIATESRPFQAHVTLARTKRPRGRELGDFFARSRADSRLPLAVDFAHLYESRLQPGGARYSIVSSVRLGTGEGGP